MTNKPMLSVERELLESCWSALMQKGQVIKALELRALLDKPESFELVEPVAPWFYFVECDDPDYSALFNHESEAQTQANDHGGHVVRLWNVPPTWKPAAQHQGEIDLEPGRLAHAENVIEQQNSVIASLRAELVDGNSHAPKQQGEPVAELQVAFFEHAPMAAINWFTPSAFESGATKLYTEQPAPVAVVMTRKIGFYGKAYDLPEEKRAYTYEDQPGNMEASKLGRAACLASPGGDSIDHGLSLLKALSGEGFGVFELERLYGVKP